MKFLVRKVREQVIWRLIIPLRSGYWRLLCAHIGKGTKILGAVSVYLPQHVSVGHDSTINEGVVINAYAPITIGNFVRMSPGAQIHTAGLEYTKPMDLRAHRGKPVVIEDGVWLGAGVIVNPGVTIGRDSVIGAGAVVTEDIPAGSVAVGVPARVIKSTRG
jgi:acetyltransferase-like isoleucine patch superfamily enzyme